ncbi:MAG: hypothetical protein LBT21_02110 [Oscillospiraceae bacterium]|nr:hypothetical protein [Oscillospiraceae bacterium]
MAQESHFRAALFGGFQKSDVLAYIETLQNRILAMQGEQQQRDRETPALRSQVQSLTAELEQARAREHSFFDNADELQRRIIVLEEDRDELRAQMLQAKVGQDRVKDVEGQVGTLILDALLYSEKIIARAKETAQIIARRAQGSVRGSVDEVDCLGEDMTRISQDFSESITQLVGRIKGVSADLSGMVDKLEPDLSDGSEQYEFDAEGRPVLREEFTDEAVQGADLLTAAIENAAKAPMEDIYSSYPDAGGPAAPILPAESAPAQESPVNPQAPAAGAWFAEVPLLTGDEPPLFDLTSEWDDDKGEPGTQQ